METAGEKSNVGLIRLNRPKALNALCNALFVDLEDALNDMEKDSNIGCIILTGSEKAFAAGLFVDFSTFPTHPAKKISSRPSGEIGMCCRDSKIRLYVGLVFVPKFEKSVFHQ